MSVEPAIANRICMYTPSASGGHARYARELLTALTREGQRRYAFELVSSEDLEQQYKDVEYEVHPILPKLRRAAGAGRSIASRTTRGVSCAC